MRNKAFQEGRTKDCKAIEEFAVRKRIKPDS